MTPLEELQAAHKRLSELRGPVETWHHIFRGGPHIVDDPGEYGGYIAALEQSRDADLIVTLHRTIYAQLHILESAAHFTYGEVDAEALELARAINGGKE